MIKHLQTLAIPVTFLVALGSAGRAQAPTAAPAQQAAPNRADQPRPQVALKVQIVISRYQGDKKVSSVPYMLSVNAAVNVDGRNRSSLRMGSDVPIGTYTTNSKEGVPTSSVQYKSVGTNIDCTGSIIDDVRYGLSINIEDSSVYPTGQGTALPNSGSLPRGVGDALSFRHFSASENVILRDGQSSEFTVATDKFTGEVIKADVTLTVVK